MEDDGMSSGTVALSFVGAVEVLKRGPNTLSDGTAFLEQLAQRMQDARSKGLAPGEETLTVSQFMALFGYEKRGSWISGYIRNMLERVGLKTVPDFGTPWRGAQISIRLDEPKPDDGIPSEEADATLRIGALEAAHINEGDNGKLASVPPDKPLNTATTIMQLRDYSQLPVMPNNNKRDVKGIITWQSIGARLALRRPCPLVKDCMDESVQKLSIKTPLFEALSTIVKHGYALIMNEKNEVSGIVTASDLASQFENLTGPFVLIGEIEGHLRRLVHGKFTIDELREANAGFEAGKEINGAADLTLGGYCALLGNRGRWHQLGLDIDREEFGRYLDDARQIRNDVMHFNPDGVSREQIDTLQNLAKFFQDLVQMKVI